MTSLGQVNCAAGFPADILQCDPDIFGLIGGALLLGTVYKQNLVRNRYFYNGSKTDFGGSTIVKTYFYAEPLLLELIAYFSLNLEKKVTFLIVIFDWFFVILDATFITDHIRI